MDPFDKDISVLEGDRCDSDVSENSILPTKH
jgi:hypothetical protein